MGVVAAPILATAEFYSVQVGGDGKPAREYNAATNTTTYRYTVTGDGTGVRTNRLKAVLIQIPDCPGKKIEIVGFSPDLPDGDPAPFSSVNPAIFQDQKDNLIGGKGIRWHGWHGNDQTPVIPVLLEPNASRVFSVTIKGNNQAGNTAVGLWYWKGKNFIQPFLPVTGPSCEEIVEPTPTPTPTATPTPEPKCPTYKMTRAVKGAIPGNVWSLFERETTTADGKALQCIVKMRKDREDFCKSNPTVQKYKIFNKPLFAVSRYDKRVDSRYRYVDQLTEAAGGQLCYAVSPLFTHLGKSACAVAPQSFLCEQHKAYKKVLGAGSRRYHPRWQTFYFDEQCEIILNPTAAQQKNACDAALVETRFTGNSPISLVWEAGFSVEENPVEVSFPLELDAAADARYEWKASAKAPLLVFDPAQSGRITSPEQLFGDWTFGGQRFASLDSGQTATSWNHGYEPLATLDQNGDGELSGAELASLALWFDENRDGIAQAGEVKSVESMGVTKIFFANPVFDEDSHAHILTIGYERIVDGEKIQLPSIDWKGKRLK